MTCSAVSTSPIDPCRAFEKTSDSPLSSEDFNKKYLEHRTCSVSIRFDTEQNKLTYTYRFSAAPRWRHHLRTLTTKVNRVSTNRVEPSPMDGFPNVNSLGSPETPNTRSLLPANAQFAAMTYTTLVLSQTVPIAGAVVHLFRAFQVIGDAICSSGYENADPLAS